jgi:hypothetical protein
MRRLFALALLLCLAVPVRAEEADLAPLAAQLAALRALPPNRLGERDGAPELTVAKHLLRDWVEANLVSVDNADDARQLEQPLNDRLRAADLTCDSVSDPHGKRCDDQADGPLFSARGYLGSIRVMLPEAGGHLVLTTAAGIECGYDESAYVYERRDGAWHRIFESERNDYTKDGYRPQNFEQVLVSPKESGKQPLVLTTSISPWCSSNWQAVYYRLFRVTPDRAAAPALLDRQEGIYAGVDQPVRSSLGRDAALIEFQDGSIDLDGFTRTVVRHFRIGADDKVVRVAPFAFTPRAIVDEWLVRPWVESALFTAPASRSRLQALHRRLHRDHIAVEYAEDGGRCRNDPTLWVIGVTPEHAAAPLYFRLRWVAPFDFTVLDIGPRKPAGCRAQPIALDEAAQQFPVLSGQ